VHGTLLERSRQLRKESTPAEIKLWSYLRLKAVGGARFRRQYQIEGFLVDFCCLKESLIVELDGSQHEGNLSYDDRRTQFCRRRDLGYCGSGMDR
jgi:very-short-patch-repair endonuclease